MRKIILGLAVSLDGYIEGPNGEFDWCFNDQDYGMKAFFKRIDTIFLGRKSYELVKTMGGPPFPNKKMYVFSTTLKKADQEVFIINGDIKKEVEKIKMEKGKDIWLFGGSSLTTSFLNTGLIDEFSLAVHPILLGSGKHLFTNITNRIPLKLMAAQTYSSGLVSLMYQIDHP
jgi:dihydrofolate reductase